MGGCGNWVMDECFLSFIWIGSLKKNFNNSFA